METIKTTLTTTAAFSDDGSKRYLLTKTWEEDKPSLAIIMLAPSEASGIVLDSTTLLVLNNAARLGYGSVTILNLFATLNDFAFRQADDEDSENLNVIVAAVKEADAAIYAAGVGKAKNKAFQKQQRQVLHALQPVEAKPDFSTIVTGGTYLVSVPAQDFRAGRGNGRIAQTGG